MEKGLIKKIFAGTILIFSLACADANADSEIISEILSSGSATKSTEINIGELSIKPYVSIGWNHGAGIKLNLGNKTMGIYSNNYLGNLGLGLIPESYDLNIAVYINPLEDFRFSADWIQRYSLQGTKTENTIKIEESIKF